MILRLIFRVLQEGSRRVLRFYIQSVKVHFKGGVLYRFGEGFYKGYIV